MKILLCGDTHASRSHMRYLIEDVAVPKEIKLLIVLGDFGFWPRNQYGLKFLEYVNHLAKKNDVEIWWLDGNHEDHIWLREEMLPYYDGINPIASSSPGAQYSAIKYLPRGHRFELDGVKFMSYGGAFSVDYESRTDGIDWFDGIENVDPDHIESISYDEVDVLLTHDVPLGKDLGYPKGALTDISEKTRLQLTYLVDKVKPHFGYGGHHHKNISWDITTERGDCRYTIINCNETMDRSWMLLDTYQIKTISEWRR